MLATVHARIQLDPGNPTVELTIAVRVVFAHRRRVGGRSGVIAGVFASGSFASYAVVVGHEDSHVRTGPAYAAAHVRKYWTNVVTRPA